MTAPDAHNDTPTATPSAGILRGHEATPGECLTLGGHLGNPCSRCGRERPRPPRLPNTGLSAAQIALRDFREALRPMTEVDLRADVAALPNDIRERLATGPHPRRWTCGVCQSFGDAAFYRGTPDLDDPRWRVWGYHEVPKADMRRADQQWYGPLADDTYRRCIATYRAAGWVPSDNDRTEAGL